MLKLATIQYPVFKPYKKPAVEIYLQGCTRGCKGCHNPELLNFNDGEDLDSARVKRLISYLREREPFFDIISFTGGDPLCSPLAEIFWLVGKLKQRFPDKRFWLFTGEEAENIPPSLKYIFDVIKTGPYREDLKVDDFPASTNQKVLYKGLDY